MHDINANLKTEVTQAAGAAVPLAERESKPPALTGVWRFLLGALVVGLGFVVGGFVALIIAATKGWIGFDC